MGARLPTNMSRTLWRIGLVAGMLGTATFVWYAAKTFDPGDLGRFASWRGILSVALAALCYSAMVPISALGWRILFQGFGVALRFRTLTEILAVAQFAKYLPGNVGVHIGRAGMVAGHGAGARPIVGSLLTEMVLAVAAALAVGAIGLIIAGGYATEIVRTHIGKPLTIAFMCLAAAALFAALLWRVPGPLSRWISRQSWPGKGAMIKAFSLYALNYVLIATGILLMSGLLLPGAKQNPPLVIAAFSLAWVAGFFAPGAPAGLGIREALMLLILRADYADSDALLIVIGTRLATVLGDIAAFLVGGLSMFASRQRPPSS